MPLVYKKSSYTDTPNDAIILTQKQASDMVWDSIEKLGFSKSWPFKGCNATLAVCAGLSSIFMTSRIRKIFKLGKYGYLLTSIPGVYAPVLANYLLYRYIVIPPILLKEEICPVCIQVQAMGIQIGSSILYPFLSIYSISYVNASNVGSIVAPQAKLFKDPKVRKEMLEIFLRTTKKMSGGLIAQTIFHGVLASATVMLQMYKIDEILDEVDKKRAADIEEILRQQRIKKYRMYVNLNTSGDCPASCDGMGSEEEPTNFEEKMEAQMDSQSAEETCHEHFGMEKREVATVHSVGMEA
ncbi:hypothetical protein M8J75_003398 [Diaphorina citri]|nr:hypothetical protein M8J75_003398 [Diaphorina citri]